VVGYLLLPAISLADCGGRDLIAELARVDPARHDSLLARSRQVVNGEGLLWEVGNGSTPPSYLFGTYHDTEAGYPDLPEPASVRFRAARVLIVELTDIEQQRMAERMARDPGFAMTRSGNRLFRHLNHADRQLAEAALGARGVTMQTARKLQPWMLFSILSVPVCQFEARSDGASVLDQRLIHEARARGMPVAGLETFEEALGAFSKIPKDAFTAILRDLLRSTEREEDIRATMLGLYQHEQVAAIQQFAALSEPDPERAIEAFRLMRIFTDAILVPRNHAWLDSLIPELRQGGAFVAFGALHLPGEEGLVELLRARGFTVRRVIER